MGIAPASYTSLQRSIFNLGGLGVDQDVRHIGGDAQAPVDHFASAGANLGGAILDVFGNRLTLTRMNGEALNQNGEWGRIFLYPFAIALDIVSGPVHAVCDLVQAGAHTALGALRQ